MSNDIELPDPSLDALMELVDDYADANHEYAQACGLDIAGEIKNASARCRETEKALRAAILADREKRAQGVQDGYVLVPTEILSRFPEINPSNYDHDDACALNAWGVELVLAAAPAATESKPIDMVLYCPNCGKQHVDKPNLAGDKDAPPPPPPGASHEEAQPFIDALADYEALWTNPPHRSHLCHDCGCIWRPADVPTNGVDEIKTEGKADTWPAKHNDEVLAALASKLVQAEAPHVTVRLPGITAKQAAAVSIALCEALVDAGREFGIVLIGEQPEAPSDDADPLTPEQEEWVMDLAEKHNLGRRVPQIGALRGVAPDVFYTDASYRTHELFCFAAELLKSRGASDV